MFGDAVADTDLGSENKVGFLDFVGLPGSLDDNVGRCLAANVEPEVVAFSDSVGEVIVAGGIGAIEDSVSAGAEKFADRVALKGAIFFGFGGAGLVKVVFGFGLFSEFFKFGEVLSCFDFSNEGFDDGEVGGEAVLLAFDFGTAFFCVFGFIEESVGVFDGGLFRIEFDGDWVAFVIPGFKDFLVGLDASLVGEDEFGFSLDLGGSVGGGDGFFNASEGVAAGIGDALELGEELGALTVDGVTGFADGVGVFEREAEGLSGDCGWVEGSEIEWVGTGGFAEMGLPGFFLEGGLDES